MEEHLMQEEMKIKVKILVNSHLYKQTQERGLEEKIARNLEEK